MHENDFKVIKGYRGYVSKPEITDLDPRFLVKGSKNVLIDYASRLVSRGGYTIYLNTNSGGGPIKSSYDWHTSTGRFFPMRVHDGKVEFGWNSTFNLLKGSFATSVMEFAKIWDNTEKIDVLLFVLGDTNTYKWSGGVSKIRLSTATTITKQGVLTNVSTLTFTAGVANVIAPTIVDSAANFLNAGFAAGDTLYVTGSTNNSRNYTISAVTAGTITLIMSDVVVTEAAGPSITIHNGEPTWAASRFLTTGTRKITYNGVEYTYGGGETTDTLTGLTAFPTATVGDTCFQTLITLANPVAIPASFKADLIGVQSNQLILGSTKSQELYGSSTLDYTNFTLTTPRAPGDPFKVVLDNYVTCIVSVDNPEQTQNSLIFGGGTSDFFRFIYKMSQDNTSELIQITKLKTASGAGLISKNAITAIKNSTAYISREPSLDTLGKIENVDSDQNVPLSDIIQNDFNSYDFTNAHVKYWKRSIFIALPVHGLVLIYDLQRKLWQPPQTIPVSRFAIIDDWLHGHSSVADETYRLFSGTNDNGAFIPQVARFAYNNGGRRDRIKNMSEYWSDGYITANGVLNVKFYLGFDGIAGTPNVTIKGSNQAIVNPQQGSTIGDEPLGVNPFGGSAFGALTGLQVASVNLLRFWQDDTLKMVDYTEHFVEYSMNTLNGQFALCSHGSNQWDAGTAIISHRA